MVKLQRTTYLTEENWQAIEKLKQTKGTPKTWLVNEAVREYIQKNYPEALQVQATS